MAGAVWLRASSEIRRRTRSIVVVSLLVAVFGGGSLAAAAGARRTASSFDRMLEHLSSPDVGLGEDSALESEVIASIAELPEVEQASQAAFLIAAPEGRSLVGVGAIASAGDGWGRTADRVLLVQGRLPEALDEVAVNEAMLDSLGVPLGARVRYVSWAPEQLEQLFFGELGEPGGPRFTMTVVGVVRHPTHLAAGSGVADDTVFAPGFYERYGDEIIVFGPSLYIKLRDGIADLATFTAGVRRIEAEFGRRAQQALGPIVDDLEISISDLHESRYAVARNAISVQAVAMWLFTGVLGLATILIVGQALARAATATPEDVSALRALGFEPRQIVASSLAVPGAALLAGAAGAIAIAVFASPLLPTGLARRAEPALGVSFDALVVVPGMVGLAVVLLGWAEWSATRAVQRARSGARASQQHPSAIASLLARIARSPSVGLGVRMALERGRGRTAAPVRTATFTAIVAVIALATVTGIGASLQRLLDTPRLYGWPADAMVSGGDDPASIPTTVEQLTAFDGIADISTFELADIVIDGRRVQGFGIERVRGDVFAPIIEGREPVSSDEIALGTRTMTVLGVQLGDTVSVSNTTPGAEEGLEEGFRVVTRDMTLVGRASFPSIDENALDDGAALSVDGYRALQPIPDFPVMLVRFAEGVDHAAMMERLVATFGDTNARGPERPGEVENLARVSGLPWVLTGFLVLLAVAAGGHALVVTVRRRARELAILKTIGFRRRQVLSTVGWQASTFALAGALVGIPLGIAAGRWAWTMLADRLGIPREPVIALGAVLLVLPLGLLTMNLLVSAMPARAAARTEAAAVLRSE